MSPQRTDDTALTPIVLVLLDGLGDRGHEIFGEQTANEHAPTPNLDAFARDAVCGMVWPLGPGLAPSSELAHWTYFSGSLDGFCGRAVLEARGHGLHVAEGQVTGYAALRERRERRDGLVWLGAAATEPELLGQIDGLTVRGLSFRLDAVAPGEAILRLDGDGASAEISDTHPFDSDLHPLLACQPLARTPTAVATAEAVNAWTEATMRRLAPRRVAVTTKWWGSVRPVPSFTARTGLRGVIVSSAAYQGGIAAMLDMEWRRPPAAKAGTDSLRARLDLVADLLAAGYDFVHCHDKSADEAGHTKSPEAKAETIAALDQALPALDAFRDAVVVITGDHATPARGRMLHSGDPVPLMIRGPGVRPDSVERFGERHQSRGDLGFISGADLLPVALNLADRAHFQGGRAGVSDAIGVSRAVTPLRIRS